MKLIDLLVQELPKRGGWPEGALTCSYGEAGSRMRLHFGTGVLGMKSYHKPSIFEFHGAYSACLWHSEEIELDQTPQDSVVITRAQYEAALAASKQVEWDGEGLPPVGCDVEFNLDTYKYSVQGIIPENGQFVNVVAHKVTTDENPVAVVYWDDKGAGRAAAFIKEAFRPIRTEAERKREETKNILAEICRSSASNGHSADLIYEAIAAGKIPGIKLSD